MPNAVNREREEQALDALIVLCLLDSDKHGDLVALYFGDDDTPLSFDQDRLPELSAEDRAALDSLPADFIDRLLRGERPLSREKA